MLLEFWAIHRQYKLHNHTQIYFLNRNNKGIGPTLKHASETVGYCVLHCCLRTGQTNTDSVDGQHATVLNPVQLILLDALKKQQQSRMATSTMLSSSLCVTPDYGSDSMFVNTTRRPTVTQESSFFEERHMREFSNSSEGEAEEEGEGKSLKKVDWGWGGGD